MTIFTSESNLFTQVTFYLSAIHDPRLWESFGAHSQTCPCVAGIYQNVKYFDKHAKNYLIPERLNTVYINVKPHFFVFLPYVIVTNHIISY